MNEASAEEVLWRRGDKMLNSWIIEVQNDRYSCYIKIVNVDTGEIRGAKLDVDDLRNIIDDVGDECLKGSNQ